MTPLETLLAIGGGTLLSVVAFLAVMVTAEVMVWLMRLTRR